jgi:hypothetical protein
MLTSMKTMIQLNLILVMVAGLIVLNLVENLIAGKYGIQINPRHLNQLVITTLIFFILKIKHKNQKQEDLA